MSHINHKNRFLSDFKCAFSFYESEFPLPTYNEISVAVTWLKQKSKQVLHTCGAKPVRHSVIENIKHAYTFTCHKLKSKDHYLLMTKKSQESFNKL